MWQDRKVIDLMCFVVFEDRKKTRYIMFKGNTFFEKKFVKIIVFNKINVSNFFQNNQEGMLYKLFKYIYAPFLMKKWVRYVKRQ